MNNNNNNINKFINMPSNPSKKIIPIKGLTPENINIWEKYLKENPKLGKLKVQVTTASSYVPIKDAKVVVEKTIGDNNFVLYELTTDMSGITDEVPLPAPDKRYSQYDGNSYVNSVYTYHVTAPGFNEIIDNQSPIFDGITTLGSAVMKPSMKKSPF